MTIAGLAHDSLFWRRLARLGAQRGPEWWVRYSPTFFGVAAAAFVPGARESVLRNLRRVRGEQPAMREAADVAKTFVGFAGCLAEVLSNGSENQRLADVVVHGGEEIDRALALGRGLIFTTAHTAGWEIIGPNLRDAHKRKVLLVMQKERDDGALELQDEAREASGISVVHVGDDPFASLPLLQHLKRGDIVAMQVDRIPTTMKRCDVTLFGEPGALPEGPFRLARLSGAPIIPVFSARLGYRRYEVHASPAVTLPRRGPPEEIRAAAQNVADALTTFLRAHPTQWFNFNESG